MQPNPTPELTTAPGMASGDPSPSPTATPPSLGQTVNDLDRTIVQTLLQQGYRYGTRNFRRAYKKVIDRLESEANKVIKGRQQGRSFERQIHAGLRVKAESHQH